MSGATAGRDAWRGRTRVARLLGVLAAALPTVVATVVAIVTARLLPRPSTGAAAAAWWATVIAAGFGAAWLVDRAARRLAPLRFLLGLTLVFPDDAPRRLKTAREAARHQPLAARISRGEEPTDAQLPPTTGGILALAAALESHDRFTRGHSERVRGNVDVLAEELGLAPMDRMKLSWAALLHDIGKLKVPDHVLNDREPLSDEAWEQLRRHPRIGRRLAAPLERWLGPWIGAISDHHERWDGTGYPRGLAGEEISLGGRITAVADTVEVMTAGRPYAAAVRPADARRELARCAGTQFDPAVVRAALGVSLQRRSRAAALLSALAGVPAIGALTRLDRQAWQGAAVAGGLAITALSGLIDPVTQPPAPPAAAPDAAPSVAPDGDGAASGTPSPRPERGPSARGARSRPVAATPGPPVDEDEPRPDDTVPPGPSAEEPPEEPRQVARGEQPVTSTRYLHPARPAPHVAHAVLPLAAREPEGQRPVNADTDRDDDPGITLNDRRPTQRWAVDVESPHALAGPVTAVVFAAAPRFAAGSIVLTVTVRRCDRPPTCETIASGALRAMATRGDWTRLSGRLAPTVATLAAGRIVVNVTSTGPATEPAPEIWVAPASRATPTALRLVSAQPSSALGTPAASSDTGRRTAAGRADWLGRSWGWRYPPRPASGSHLLALRVPGRHLRTRRDRYLPPSAPGHHIQHDVRVETLAKPTGGHS